MGDVKQAYEQLLELMTKYRLASLAWAIWSAGVVTYVVVQVFSDVTKITTPVAAALATVFGLPALAVAILKWRSGGGDP